jgi:FixJ family two-component response regulator
MMPAEALVSIVDDDESVREALPDLIKIFGFDVQAFSSAAEFPASKALANTGCLVLDVAMPGMSGPELQNELAKTGITIPIIFITAHKDENERLALIRRGAVACLFKPFSAAILRETLDDVFNGRKSVAPIL